MVPNPTCVHLYEDAAQRPHVDGEVVGDPEQNLRAAVEPEIIPGVNKYPRQHSETLR